MPNAKNLPDWLTGRRCRPDNGGLMERETPPDEAPLDSPLLKELGIEPVFSGQPGPPVDREKLRRYLRKELGPHARAEVGDYVTVFREWFDELLSVAREENQRSQLGE